MFGVGWSLEQLRCDAHVLWGGLFFSSQTTFLGFGRSLASTVCLSVSCSSSPVSSCFVLSSCVLRLFLLFAPFFSSMSFVSLCSITQFLQFFSNNLGSTLLRHRPSFSCFGTCMFGSRFVLDGGKLWNVVAVNDSFAFKITWANNEALARSYADACWRGSRQRAPWTQMTTTSALNLLRPLGSQDSLYKLEHFGVATDRIAGVTLPAPPLSHQKKIKKEKKQRKKKNNEKHKKNKKRKEQNIKNIFKKNKRIKSKKSSKTKNEKSKNHKKKPPRGLHSSLSQTKCSNKVQKHQILISKKMKNSKKKSTKSQNK